MLLSWLIIMGQGLTIGIIGQENANPQLYDKLTMLIWYYFLEIWKDLGVFMAQPKIIKWLDSHLGNISKKETIY